MLLLFFTLLQIVTINIIVSVNHCAFARAAVMFICSLSTMIDEGS
jgi:hypothetical protein